MEAPRPARDKHGPDAALSRELADFLVEFSIVLHKRAMYPAGHPFLQSSAVRFAHGLQLAISWSLVAVSYAQPAGAGFFMNS